jgi:hypothetical protein
MALGSQIQPRRAVDAHMPAGFQKKVLQQAFSGEPGQACQCLKPQGPAWGDIQGLHGRSRLQKQGESG